MARITGVDIKRFDYPLLGEFKFFKSGSRPSILVRLTDEDGVQGWGQSVPIETWTYETVESVESTLRHYLAPAILGADPSDLAQPGSPCPASRSRSSGLRRAGPGRWQSSTDEARRQSALPRRSAEAKTLVPSLRLANGLPDLGAAVRALIDEVDCRHAPMRLDLPDVHRKQSDATGAEDRGGLDFMMVNVSWHVALPSQRKHGSLDPGANLAASGGGP
jgi:hypothetical protein